MMKCRQYLFKLTSGQLDEATPGERMQARLHLLICSRCRGFTRNDAALDAILRGWREQMQTPETQPPTPHDADKPDNAPLPPATPGSQA